MLKIAETFLSLQGESTFAGSPCFFIRLATCNLRCNYCDSAYAWQASGEADTAQLVTLAVSSGVKLVEVTGGEPLLQAETPQLCDALLAAGFTVLVETNGSQPIDRVSDRCHRIVDRKLPGSGMAEFHFNNNYAKLTPRDEVKFVVSDEKDIDFAFAEIRKFHLDEIGCPLLISPVWGRIKLETLAQRVIDANLPIRMQLQMHKIIWGDIPGV